MALTIHDAELLMLPIYGAGRIDDDAAIQQRVELDHAKVKEYAAFYQQGHDLGHLVVFTDGAQWLLADGFHRVAAARLAGLHTLPCDVYHGSRRDALLYATSCNLHGKPLTNADKRRRVMTLLSDDEWAQWSDNSIAKHCGVAQSFVSRLRHECSLNSEISEDTTSPSLDSETSEEPMPGSLNSEISENGTVPTRRTYRNRYGQRRTMETRKIGHLPPAPNTLVTVTEDGFTYYDPLPREPLVLAPEEGEADELPAPRVAPEALGRLSDRQRARLGPRDEKPPGSLEWCWQTLDLLKIRWQRKELTDQQFEETLQEIKDHEVWKVVPPEHPYGSLEALLSAEVGLDFFSQPDFFSQLDEAMRSLAVLHTSIATLTPADTGDPDVDMGYVVALCLAFKARCAEVEHVLRHWRAGAGCWPAIP